MNHNTIKRRSSIFRSFKKKRATEYHYIQNFENVNDKICKKFDKNNDSIYERNCALYTKTKRFLEKNNAIFKMDGPPPPPRVPSNYNLFIIHKNRNSHTNNKIQTIAILYLLQHNYKLVIDPDVEFITKVMSKENKLFEPYMAIDIASSLNKDFINDIAKKYKFNSTLIDNPELLSVDEKIAHFNKNGIIQYIDLNSSSIVDAPQFLEPSVNFVVRSESPPSLPAQPLMRSALQSPLPPTQPLTRSVVQSPPSPSAPSAPSLHEEEAFASADLGPKRWVVNPIADPPTYFSSLHEGCSMGDHT